MTKILLFATALTLTCLSSFTSADDATQKLIVYKSPTCGCCSSWISHMESNGFEIEAINENDMTAIKNQYGIDAFLQSCHTAINPGTGLVFEGHVPAGAIKKFLSSPPENTRGLSVPGMPAGSPGMEMGSRFDPYQIVQLNKGQPPTLYMNVRTQSEQSKIGLNQEMDHDETKASALSHGNDEHAH